MIADSYGDAPYSEALDFQTIVPAYDNQEQLYGVIQTLLDEGIANLNRTNEGEALPTSNDFIHNGNVSSWIKTAYTIKARYLHPVSETSGYDANAVLAAVSQAYTSNDDDAEVTQFQN
ncbi:MAG: SusD/RagB family nutrient-binding outer membrane lipoprotein, partial [Spirosomataceae bacterium]